MRRGVLAACVLLGCSFESTGAAEGTGDTLGMSTTLGTTTMDMTSSGPEPVTGPSTTPTTATTSTTTSGVGPTTTAGPDLGGSATTSSSSDDSSSTGDPDGPLSDMGLVARYFLDEADGGTAPTFALDAADDPFDLPLEYVEGTMHYASVFGHRGLAFDVVGADDAARGPILGSKFDGLHGVTELTFEVVVRLDDSAGNGSRLIHFGGTGSGVATLSSESPQQLQFAWNDTIVREWDYTAFSDGEAHVVHVITDTNAASDASRFRLFVDGNELLPSASTEVAAGEPASVSAGAIFALGNRNQDRAMDGILFYVAIYGVAIPDATIAAHVSALTENDDTPR